MSRARRLDLVCLVVLAGFIVSLGLYYYLAYYLVKPYPLNTFLLDPEDRFVPGAQGIGNHFFGDLYVVWRQTRGDSPYLDPQLGIASNYFPFTHLLFKPLSWLPYNWAVAVYLAGFVAAYVGVLWRGLRWVGDRVRRAQAVLLLTAMCYPFLFLVDRANIEGVVFLLLAAFAALVVAGKPRWAAVMLAGAAAFKAFPLLLAAVFVTRRQWVPAIITVVLTGLLTLVGLVVLRGGFGAIGDNIDGIRNSLDYFSDAYTGRIATQHGTSIKGAVVALSDKWPGTFHWLVDVHQPFAYVVLAAGVAAGTFLRLELWERLTILMVTITVVPPVSYDYRLLQLVIPMLLLLRHGREGRRETVAAILFALVLIPKSLPILYLDISTSVIIHPLLLLVLAGVAAAGFRRGPERRAAMDGDAVRSPAVARSAP